MANFKKVIQLELNEVSKAVIDRMIAQGKLPNFRFIQENWVYLSTASEDKYEHLEPWIQWTSVHTGKKFGEHQVFHLSDSEKLKHIQIWEALSERGIESAIIGSMNAIRGRAQGGMFFSDPWAKSNDCYPSELKPLWDLISRKVQGHATEPLTLSDLVRGFFVCLKFRLPWSLYFKIGAQLVSQKLNPRNKWKLACVFDEMLAALFKRVLKTTDFGFYTLFLNANAHYQHHYWRAFDSTPFDPKIQYPDLNRGDDPIAYGYEAYDRILGDLIRQFKGKEDVLFAVATGLSQVPYTAFEAEGGMNYYRLKDHRAFASGIGLKQYEVFPLMSRDWQIAHRNERESIMKALGAFQVNGLPLFKMSEENPGFLFVETAYTKGVTSETKIENHMLGMSVPFESVFTNIAIKSGHHSGIGSLWLSSAVDGFEKEKQQIELTRLFDLPLQVLS